MIIGANISKNFVNIKDDAQIQQCGIDLRVGKIFKLNGDGALDYTNEKRELPDQIEIFNSDKDNKIILKEGIYTVQIADKVKIPNNMAGFAYPRSSLLRMGATIYTAVHDPGYEGAPTYLLQVFNPITIYNDARIAQIVYIECSSVNGEYEGIYNEKNKTE
ncbi:deoxycytidine triphosphate deaminase, putative [Methanococcus aeolicus Nankai-3]|uniref:Deoxycytidine triphosphate deaminase, putative n=1 Tax=Methanococcus aeolicus (strain ATCC BAA-1280 / DSM 17508 / OCM 812 / Nankai-3) TaxID=419665 RepID=A6UWS6_META3|nr:deoxyuridine 5'-triphosphate nucleotidohydrolase [Methanococcus aeolicus]ABR56948.1 deoxycytidine triphosphate deaminase, putative [Methanococcus aeolicus Nankai-3]